MCSIIEIQPKTCEMWEISCLQIRDTWLVFPGYEGIGTEEMEGGKGS